MPVHLGKRKNIMTIKQLKKFISILLLCALSTNLLLAQGVKKAKPNKIAQYKSRVVSWGINKQVNVHLFSGEKINGRLAEIKDDLIVVQLATNGQITSREVQYEDIKKISEVVGAGKVVGYTALGILAGVGATVAVIFIAIYANEH